MYLLDSDVLIDYFHAIPAVLDFFKKNTHQKFATSIICLAEIWEGLVYLGDNAQLKIFESFLPTLEIIPLDLATVKQFAMVRRDLRKQKNLIDNFDILIAATAIVQDAILVTGNKKHFRRIPHLRLLEP